jgi:hypothetical protein
MIDYQTNSFVSSRALDPTFPWANALAMDSRPAQSGTVAVWQSCSLLCDQALQVRKQSPGPLPPRLYDPSQPVEQK